MLTNHFVSLELSLALRDAGYTQEGSTFYWVMLHPSSLVLPGPSWQLMYHGQLVYYTESDYLFIAAPIASELMDKIGSCFNEWSMGYDDSGCYWQFFLGGRGSGSMVDGRRRAFNVLDLGGEDEPEDTPTNALAKLTLYLIKEGILKL